MQYHRWDQVAEAAAAVETSLDAASATKVVISDVVVRDPEARS